MSTTDFTPERSAAIRQLLIDTVAEEPRRRKRLQILLTSVLSGVALVLAGGTAALALSGVIHLGGGDTPPAPVPTPTQTVTPTPTPTPTPTEQPLVQTAPVLPHDVNALASSTRWSLDLPGDRDCTGITSFTLSEGRAVFLSGSRPKEYENGGDCAAQRDEDLGLTLVDTSNGRVLWSREWRFTPERVDYEVGFTVLGTTGRALLSYPDRSSGPHDVIDLTTGATVATFQPTGDGDIAPNRDIKAVLDDSGDVVILQHKLDGSGREVEDTLTRVNPTDPSHPVWTRSLDQIQYSLDDLVPGASVITAEGWDLETTTYQTSIFDLSTGKSTIVSGQQFSPMSQILIGQPYRSDLPSPVLTAYDLNGHAAWTKPLAAGSHILTARTPGTQLAGTPDSGEFFIVDSQTIALYDQATGERRWSVPTPTCIDSGYGPGDAMLDVANDAFIMTSGLHRCELSRATGAILPGRPPYQAGGIQVFGLANVYADYGDSGPATAYDLSTGAKLWALDRIGWPKLSFQGGYLISQSGNHIESIG